MNKGYAFGFLIVLLVVVLGLYVALTGFMSSRAALHAQATLAPTSLAVEATDTNPPPTPAPTIPALPTPVPGITVTLTALAPAEPVAPSAPTPGEPPAPAPTEPPLPAPTDTPVAEAPPTPVPAPAYQFRIAGPPGPDPNYPNCCYIVGTVRDAAGNGLEGVLVQAFNEWTSLPPSTTKGGSEAGQYDIPLGRDAVAWYIMITDAGGNQISTQVQVQFDPNVAGSFRVDWLRTY